MENLYLHQLSDLFQIIKYLELEAVLELRSHSVYCNCLWMMPTIIFTTGNWAANSAIPINGLLLLFLPHQTQLPPQIQSLCLAGEKARSVLAGLGKAWNMSKALFSASLIAHQIAWERQGDLTWDLTSWATLDKLLNLSVLGFFICKM